MAKEDISINGAIVGALAGLVTEVTLQEITGHHFTAGVLELTGAAIGLWRLDRRLLRALQDTLSRAGDGGQDYQQVKQRIEELTQDLPELKEILGRMVDAGIQAHQA